MSGDCKKTFLRILVGVGVPVIVIAGAVILKVFGGPPCFVYVITKAVFGHGILCAGCGAGRASLALLNLHPIQAFCYNPFYITVLPFLSYYLFKQYIAFVTGKDILPFFSIGIKTAYTLIAVIVLFTVLRNIPVFPFIYLNPNIFNF